MLLCVLPHAQMESTEISERLHCVLIFVFFLHCVSQAVFRKRCKSEIFKIQAPDHCRISQSSKFAMTDCEDWPTCFGFFSESFKFTQFASATLKIGSSEAWLKTLMKWPKLRGETFFWYQNNLGANPLVHNWFDCQDFV